MQASWSDSWWLWKMWFDMHQGPDDPGHHRPWEVLIILLQMQEGPTKDWGDWPGMAFKSSPGILCSIFFGGVRVKWENSVLLSSSFLPSYTGGKQQRWRRVCRRLWAEGWACTIESGKATTMTALHSGKNAMGWVQKSFGVWKQGRMIKSSGVERLYMRRVFQMKIERWIQESSTYRVFNTWDRDALERSPEPWSTICACREQGEV